MIRPNLTLLRLAGLSMMIAAPLAAMALEPATRPAAEPATRPATQPSTRPAGPATKPVAEAPVKKFSDQFLQNQRTQRDSQRNTARSHRDGGEVKLSDLVQLSLDRGLIKAEIQTSATPNESLRYKVKGSNAIFTTNRSPYNITQFVNNVLVRTMVSNDNLIRYEPDAKNDTDTWTTQLTSNPNNLSIRTQSVLGYTYFSQMNVARAGGFGGVNAAQMISLNVQEYQPQVNNQWPRMVTSFRATARNLNELRAKHPAEFRKYLVPMLSKLSDLSFLAPGASDVYSVFSEIPADPQVSAMVDGLLPDLDSDAFPVREAASKHLLELGPPAVLAVLRKDLSALSDEQRAQIGRLIAAHRKRGDLTMADARQDPTFLADCLEHPDLAVRTAAKASLEKLLGEPLQFDPQASGEKLAAASDAIRKKIVESQTAAAATQPAAQPENNVAPVPAPARLGNAGAILVK